MRLRDFTYFHRAGSSPKLVESLFSCGVNCERFCNDLDAAVRKIF